MGGWGFDLIEGKKYSITLFKRSGGESPVVSIEIRGKNKDELYSASFTDYEDEIKCKIGEIMSDLWEQKDTILHYHQYTEDKISFGEMYKRMLEAEERLKDLEEERKEYYELLDRFKEILEKRR